jgi:uncharacterized pyridoxal phosphate-containing UPF0001 family protein
LIYLSYAKSFARDHGGSEKKDERAASKAGRNPEDKTYCRQQNSRQRRFTRSVEAGARVFGENKVQEAEAKIWN